MKYTKNYRLPQWVESDRIMMNDFNSAMTNIESGIDGAKAEAKAGDAALSSQISEAKQTASDAQSTANAAKTAANQKHYVVGTYTGGNADLTITLGFRPSFLIITGMTPSYTTTGTGGYEQYIAFTGGRTLMGRVDIIDTGFIVRDYNASYHPFLAEKGRTYEYIAFK